VVGASECGLATVEALLMNPRLSFNYVTLLAPGGISVGGPACEYTAGVVARLGLEARVTVLDAELVGIDAAQRVAQLGDVGETRLAYDLLLVTSGLQEQTRGSVGESDPEAAGVVFNALELE
jgi:NADH dehydrogenase FAD-containing subunit